MGSIGSSRLWARSRLPVRHHREGHPAPIPLGLTTSSRASDSESFPHPGNSPLVRESVDRFDGNLRRQNHDLFLIPAREVRGDVLLRYSAARRSGLESQEVVVGLLDGYAYPSTLRRGVAGGRLARIEIRSMDSMKQSRTDRNAGRGANPTKETLSVFWLWDRAAQHGAERGLLAPIQGIDDARILDDPDDLRADGRQEISLLVRELSLLRTL